MEAASSGSNGDTPCAIKSALMKFPQPAYAHVNARTQHSPSELPSDTLAASTLASLLAAGPGVDSLRRSLPSRFNTVSPKADTSRSSAKRHEVREYCSH